jgi:2,4-dienoyl-CoA reductase-like NADH-dependent reductase (Old Yellow Enzyme family)
VIAFPRLFEPLTIGHKVTKNRIVSTAHATGYDSDGLLTERYVAYHARKAEGGAGIVLTFGSASVFKGSVASYGSVRLWDPANEPALRELARRAHLHGALIMSQATHMGRRGNTLRGNGPLWAPGPEPEPVHREIPHVMSIEEIQAVIAAFADAARRLEACGWDGIEVTSFGGHLIEQFWSPVVNRRTDRYGGDFQNRMRFVEEVLRAVRAAVSDEFIVGFRMTADPMTDVVGLTRDDMLKIAAHIDSLGLVDLFNVSGGTGATLSSQAATVPPVYYPEGCYNHLAHAIREAVSAPVLVAGRILTPELAEQSLAHGDCDLVAMTRAIIADPDLPRKAQAGEPARIRPCISINEECIGRLYTGLPIRCAVNPGVADEELATIAPADRRRRVVVVGGGPSGMEAARVAAVRGHAVLLFEAEEELGGQMRVAAAAPNRPLFDRYLSWLKGELTRLQVEVRTGVTVNVDEIGSASPDMVIIATGSRAVVPYPSSRNRFATDVDLLLGRVNIRAGEQVMVYDREGHARGATAAVVAAVQGARVELVTDLLIVAEELDPTQKPSIYSLLAKHGVTQTGSQLLVNGREGLRLRDAWSNVERPLDADVVLFVGFSEANSWLAEQARAAFPGLQLLVVGDALAPRRLHDAVAEGIRAGNTI